MKILDKIIKRAKEINYQLPDGHNYIHVVGISGGGDSSALAIVLKKLFPNREFLFVFTDTMAEPPSVHDSILRLEEYLDINVIRITPELGFFDLLEKQGNFIPGKKSRWCTKMLKILPFQAWCKSILEPGKVLCSHVGIRADETGRNGLANVSQVVTNFPLQALGVTREDVFQLLQESPVGVPQLYNDRSRSGCQICPFLRRTEMLALLHSDPKTFERAMHIEKLTDEDRDRFFTVAMPLSKEIRIATNHLSLPIPPRIDRRSAESALPVVFPKHIRNKRSKPQESLFTDTKASGAVLWVGAEFYVHDMLSGPGVWWQQAIAISTTKAGLMAQLKTHYDHRLRTPEVRGLTVESIKQELKYAVYMIELPDGVVEVDGPSSNSFTWQQGIALSQLRQQNSFLVRTLQAAGLEQEIDDLKTVPQGVWELERLESFQAAKERIKQPVGKILAMDLLDIELDQKQQSFHQNNLKQSSLFLGEVA